MVVQRIYLGLNGGLCLGFINCAVTVFCICKYKLVEILVVMMGEMDSLTTKCHAIAIYPWEGFQTYCQSDMLLCTVQFLSQPGKELTPPLGLMQTMYVVGVTLLHVIILTKVCSPHCSPSQMT